ncbi:MAG: LacI family DNA-binding transcriptional regulator [Anaerolineae bacterium]|nr:LacI family DNA-binding transcriptional regulator [Anaerolineae bacterium]
MPVTIRDVARKLNLSVTTVSRALDGYDDVAEETRQRVIAAALEMEYVPNRAARQLRRQRADTIGYVLPAHEPRFADPFFSEFVAGLGDEAGSSNVDLLISTASPNEEEEQLVYQRWVHGHKVDGFVLNHMRLRDWRVIYLDRKEVPFVSLERTLDPVEYACIEVDGFGAVRELVLRLVEMGHRRIAFVCGPPHLVIQADRYAGYRDGLRSAGIMPTLELIAESDLTHQGGYHAAQQLLSISDPPSAILCINDLTAFGVYQAVRERGLQPNRDICIAGFDGLEITRWSHPELITIDQPVYDIARQLVKMLLMSLNESDKPYSRVMIKPKIMMPGCC